MPEPVPPLLFAAAVVLVPARAAGAGGAGGAPAGPTRRRWDELARPHLDHQRDLAQSLGMPLRSWLLLRGLCAGAGLLTGLLTGIPILTIGGSALGLFGLPWL